MDKTAQKRDRLHRLREKVDIFGRGAEALSPTFAGLMEKLRETDDKIRESLLEDDIKLKDVLKSARQNFNRREYMQAAADLSTFHEKLEQVVDTLKVLEFDVDTAHHEFLGTGLPSESVEKLKRTQERIKAKKTKKAAQKAWIEKHAGLGSGLSDLWYVLTDDRGKALRAWEKKYPSKMRQLKSHTSTLINKSEHLFSTLLSSLKEMSAGRAARNLDRYLKGAKKLTDTFNTYNTQYEKYYEDNIDNFLSKLLEKEKAAAALKAEKGEPEKGEPTEEAKKVKTEETGLGEKEIATPAEEVDPRSYAPPSSLRQPTPASERPESEVVEQAPDTTVDSKPPSHHESIPPTVVPPTATTPPSPPSLSPTDLYNMVRQRGAIPQAGVPVEFRPTQHSMLSPQSRVPATTPMSEAPATTPDSKPPTARGATQLIHMLESLSNESPEMMALEINKFAKSIQKTNPQTSRKLLAIVEEILDGK